MGKRLRTVRAASFLGLLIVGLVGPVSAGDGVAEIIAPWEGNGRLYKVGPGRLQFLGSFEGIMYVRSGGGDFDTALFVCPAIEEIDVASNTTTTHGRCHIVIAGGNIFSEFECVGDRKICKGSMTLTAGTGEFAGITGSGAMEARTVMSSLGSDVASGHPVEEASGIAVWPSFEYSVPGGE